MSDHLTNHLIHAAAHDKDSKASAVVLIVMGLFFTPFLIGIPMILIGAYRLCK